MDYDQYAKRILDKTTKNPNVSPPEEREDEPKVSATGSRLTVTHGPSVSRSFLAPASPKHPVARAHRPNAHRFGGEPCAVFVDF